MFFAGKDEVHKTMRRIVKRLEKAKIPYAVVGGMAVNAHGHQRTTGDVDLLLAPSSFAAFRRLFVPKNYTTVPQQPQRVVDRVNRIKVDILVSGMFPGSGDPGPISYPDPTDVSEVIEKIRVIDLPTLVQLKLAALRPKDFADVIELIRSNNLDESFQTKLHPSVRDDYIEALEQRRREEIYQERRRERLIERMREAGYELPEE